MAKNNRIPKKIAGVKVPKPLRKSKMLNSMLASSIGRDLLANALTAGAGAAAAVLLEHRDDVGSTARSATKKSARAVGLAGNAVQSGFSAAMDIVTDTVLPSSDAKKKKGNKSRTSAPRAAVH